MKKIGILTYFGDYNNGTNLQAYSVWKIVEKYHPGAEVRILDFHTWKHVWRPMLYWATPQSIKNDFVRRKKNLQFLGSLPLTDRKLIAADRRQAWEFIDSFGFDKIYVGSDTLLELHRTTPDEITPYWLTAPEVKAEKILIAASSRDVAYETLSPRRKQLLVASVASFGKMGVRDEATFKLIRRLAGETDPRLSIVPDPTFSYEVDPAPAAAYVRRRGLDRCERPLVYLHVRREDRFALDLAARLKAAGYLIASIRPFKAADILMNDLSPFEYAGIFRYMHVSVTHRFHDSIFSLKNLVPVLTYLPDPAYATAAGDSKYSSLMKDFGLQATNLLSRPADITAEGILRQLPVAMEAFRARKDAIAGELAAKRIALENFVKDTTSFP